MCIKKPPSREHPYYGWLCIADSCPATSLTSGHYSRPRIHSIKESITTARSINQKPFSCSF